MSKDEIIDVLKYIALMVTVTGCIWGFGKFFADTVSDMKVITPTDGVECIVVS